MRYTSVLLISSPVILYLTNACSPPIPCGVIPDSVELTNELGTLHIKLSQYGDCSDVHTEPIDFSPIKQVTVEYDVGKEMFRTEDEGFLAKPTNDVLGFDLPTVPQNFETAYGAVGSDTVTISGASFGTIDFQLPGLKIPENDEFGVGVTAFYSEKMNKFFFVYSNTDGGDSVAACALDGTSCRVSEFNFLNSMNLDHESGNVRVYDDMHLVGFPIMCCLCISHQWYLFDGDGIARNVDILDTAFMPTVVDSRNGYAYSAQSNMDADQTVTGVSIRQDYIGIKSVPADFEVWKLDGGKVDALFETNTPIGSGSGSGCSSAGCSLHATPDGECFCDAECHLYGDCCQDVCESCALHAFCNPNSCAAYGCHNMGGHQQCQCDESCFDMGDCCEDVCHPTACGNVHKACKPTCAPEGVRPYGGGYSGGVCGVFMPEAECQCYDGCQRVGNCCYDWEAFCKGDDSCEDDPEGIVAEDGSSTCEAKISQLAGMFGGREAACAWFDPDDNGNARYMWELCPSTCGKCPDGGQMEPKEDTQEMPAMLCSGPGLDWECPPGFTCFCSKAGGGGGGAGGVGRRNLRRLQFGMFEEGDCVCVQEM
eukprot:CAMPEP_0113935244 /NCGR_PEP_ID=MMETSP1339-20121228/2423_1 /TAXON_ID=94617 /ORGANISM="Fibrocapsa japonica" /LENGTH=594 /DNA_ID=CAMNT_0000937315 /DNA_START=33 /DNA_END=1817 /DNA_ORIENTATION=+ /assembly_acc=CAM_ASM_000762